MVLKDLKEVHPYEKFLFSRGLVANLRCPRCNDEVEDLHHMLLQCPCSLEVRHCFQAECGPSLGSLQSNSWSNHLRTLAKSTDEEDRRNTTGEIWKQ